MLPTPDPRAREPQMIRRKSVFDRIAQRNRLFSKFAGPESASTSARNKARIFRVLFGWA